MPNYKIKSTTLLPCRVPWHYGVFCNAKYRGGVRRTEGLALQKILYTILFSPLFLGTRFTLCDGKIENRLHIGKNRHTCFWSRFALSLSQIDRFGKTRQNLSLFLFALSLHKIFDDEPETPPFHDNRLSAGRLVHSGDFHIFLRQHVETRRWSPR